MLSYSNTDFLHWNYFIALENDLEKVSRYIEFCTDNEKTYSIELAKLLIAASSEIDVVLKMFCSLFHEDCTNITQYQDSMKRNCPEVITEVFSIPRYSMKSTPWENWNLPQPKAPDWWKAYTNVKHHRDIKYSDANLKNTINSMGALLILLTYYYKEKTGESMKEVTRFLQPDTSIISLKREYYYSIRVG